MVLSAIAQYTHKMWYISMTTNCSTIVFIIFLNNFYFQNLFGFGDKDGKLCEAKLQHPLGVTMSNNSCLYVADTYNHKIKRIDTMTNTITSLKWDAIGQINDNIFNEPSGLFIREEHGKLYVTDTNNHCIKIMHLSDDNNIREINKLILKATKNKTMKFDKSKYKTLATKTLHISSKGGKIILKVNMAFKDEIKLTTDAPRKWSVICTNELWSCVPQTGSDTNSIDTVISVENSQVNNTFYIIYNFIACKGDLCLPKSFILEFNVSFNEKQPTEICENLKIFSGLNDGILNG